MANQQAGVWGIDIGLCALKALRLEVIDGQVTATAFDYVEHPKILSQPDADPDQLTREALEKFLSRNSLKGDLVAVSVPGQSGLARFVKLPPVEEKKINDIVRFEAKQQIPFPLEEVIWDYQKIGSGVVTDGFAMETEIGLFAMKRDMVNRALQQFKDVNIDVHLVQMAPLALCNFVSYDLLRKGTGEPEAAEEGAEPAGDDDSRKRCVVALDIGADNSNLVITDGERIIWQRPIPQGGNHFTRALTKDLKLTFAKAEHLKRNATKSPDLKKILSALKPVLNDFVGEVQRSLGYFTNTHRNAQIGYMVGLGNAFRLPGLQKFLSEKLQLEVRKLQKLERLTGDGVTGAPAFQQNVLSFAVAYGLALQGLGRTRLHTNLLPQDIRIERMVRAKKPWAVAAAAAVLVGAVSMTGAYALQFRQYGNKNVKAALDLGKEVHDRWDKNNKAFSTKMGKIEDDENNVRSIIAGQDERLDWILLNRFVNECLPVPGRRVEGTYKTIIAAKDPKDALLVVTDKQGKDHKVRFDSEPGVVVDGKVVASILHDNKSGKLQNPGAWESLRAGQEVAVIYQPDPDVRKYWNYKAQKAYLKLWQRQATVQGGDSKAEDEGVEDLIQINLEAVESQYTTDLKAYFNAIKNDKRAKENLETSKLAWSVKERENLPEGRGWVIELRGYTYHKGDELNFLTDVLLKKVAARARKKEDSEQNAAPEKANKSAADKTPAPADKPATDKTPTDQPLADATGKPETGDDLWKKVIEGNISHAVLYHYYWFDNPDPVRFELIGDSVLGSLVSGGGMAGGKLGGMMGVQSGSADGGSEMQARAAGKATGGMGGMGGGWQSLLGGGRGGGMATTGGPMNSKNAGMMGMMGGRGAGGTMPDGGSRFKRPGSNLPFNPGDTVRGAGTRDKDDERPKVGPTRTEFIILFVWKEPLPSDDRNKSNADDAESEQANPSRSRGSDMMNQGLSGR
ncbi:MAG TPA: type IV pilus assembly protein PilM [Gemmataceae bacterium]|jgi:type IV pilus assembly protein PilM|nr:type IV pilus assembly protein PilM [Gemmataceae bacterium]